MSEEEFFKQLIMGEFQHPDSIQDNTDWLILLYKHEFMEKECYVRTGEQRLYCNILKPFNVRLTSGHLIKFNPDKKDSERMIIGYVILDIPRLEQEVGLKIIYK